MRCVCLQCYDIRSYRYNGLIFASSSRLPNGTRRFWACSLNWTPLNRSTRRATVSCQRENKNCQSLKENSPNWKWNWKGSKHNGKVTKTRYAYSRGQSHCYLVWLKKSLLLFRDHGTSSNNGRVWFCRIVFHKWQKPIRSGDNERWPGWKRITIWKNPSKYHPLQRNFVYEYSDLGIIPLQIAHDDKEIQQLKTDKARLMHEVGFVLVTCCFSPLCWVAENTLRF